MAKTEAEKLNDAKFKNRRKMAYWSLYTILFVTLSVTIKILIMPAMSSIEQYTPILSWSISILGGVIVAYIGASSYEQSADKTKFSMTGEIKEEDEDDSDWERERRRRRKEFEV